MMQRRNTKMFPNKRLTLHILLLLSLASKYNILSSAFVTGGRNTISSSSDSAFTKGHHVAFITTKTKRTTATTTATELLSSIVSSRTKMSSLQQQQQQQQVTAASTMSTTKQQSVTSVTAKTQQLQAKATTTQRVVAVQTPIVSIEQFQQFVKTSATTVASATATTIIPPRYTVIKFYASWCKTCAKFSLKYDKLVAKHSDWIVLPNNHNQHDISKIGSLQFGTVEYSACRAIFNVLNVTALPSIHVYDPYGTKVIDLAVPPSKFDQVATTINHYVQLYENELQQQHLVQAQIQVQQEQYSNIERDDKSNDFVINHNHDDELLKYAILKESYHPLESIIAAATAKILDDNDDHGMYTDTDDDSVDECQYNYYDTNDDVDAISTVHQAAIDVSYHSRSFDCMAMQQQQYQQSEQQEQVQHHQQEHRPSWWKRLPKVVRIVWKKTITPSQL
jgi:thiol-disulfide isomerase/thioredoxin